MADGAEGRTKHPLERAVVVTVTFKGASADRRADRLEAAARRIGHNGLFTEEVDVIADSRTPPRKELS